ncbi:hypothetical protein GGI25_004103 [Coemansia spiralis]|uniref:Uncharacterized protein n=2 Tax=Coemansia TaxID=4863 RepID=A0A9W8G5E4_9FUNG|nr:hypothetical protein BX070DRAFT_236803 [Coemansia spiralis]KAJ1990636.1 hypothetical protein EDC05_003951 [Coemansia umbellata]KAJ2622387.1 hypothetical protein GGI26_003250 [Coemansia sp. RSA 1358]KAJ2675054.1 hypothetical protein GGI25_004103 [Coemansia spiralis]
MLTVAKRIEDYFSAASSEQPHAHWEVSIAHHVLQSCQLLFTELDGIKVDDQSTSILALCRSQWSTAEAHIDSVLLALDNIATYTPSESKLLAQKCRQVVSAMRACIVSLTACKELERADSHALQSATMALQAVAVEIKWLQNELKEPSNSAELQPQACQQIAAEPTIPVDHQNNPTSTRLKEGNKEQGAGTESRDIQNKQPESGSESTTNSLHPVPSVRTALESQPKLKPNVQTKQHIPESHFLIDNNKELVVKDALAAASSLAELLRIFTRVSQQSWATARNQLSHAPSVPSPLSSGSIALRHRRWVSEEIESDTPSAPGLQISIDGKPMAVNTGKPAESAHMRNRSESRIQISNAHQQHPAPALRKSALSLRRPNTQLTGSPIGTETNERSKQVRFMSAPTPESEVDQSHLNDLVLLLSQFEKAVATLQSAVRDQNSGREATKDYAQAVRGLATAFIQISKLSSMTGMVKHYDKPTLAQFKTTTQTVKQLMPLFPKS